MQYVAEKTGIPENNVLEAVSLLNRSNSAMAQEEDSFTMAICHYSEAECRNLAETVVDFVCDARDQLAQTMGDFDIFVLEPSVVSVKDTSISDYQNNFKAGTLSTYTTIEKNKDAFAAAQWQCFCMPFGSS